MEDGPDARVGIGKFFDDKATAIGGTVVDDNQFDGDINRRMEDAVDNRAEGVGLIKHRHENA
jgi:hypothetical protein